MLKACGTWAYVSSSWVVTNLLWLFKLPLITTCKVPGTVGPLEIFILMFYTSQWFFPRGWFSQGSSTSITGPDFAVEAGGDKLPSERWSFFGPKAIQKFTNDPGMSSKISCPARPRGELSHSKLASYFQSLILLALLLSRTTLWMCAIHIISVPKYKVVG